MSEKIYNPPSNFVKNSVLQEDQYLEMQKRSKLDPEGFWGDQGKGWIGLSHTQG